MVEQDISDQLAFADADTKAAGTDHEEFQFNNLDSKEADRSKSLGDEDRQTSLLAQTDKTRTQSDDLIAI